MLVNYISCGSLKFQSINPRFCYSYGQIVVCRACVWFLFCNEVLSVLSSFLRKRELI